ncbi:hypothetical protein GCM10010954_07060 [Halobacillus andaensis]|uniref:Flagellar FliJ protein n=1 Tax=Halobacillus andaensis TaxID=1176239 RepID=A0A917ETS6_HALAA|nr:flagellar export protein FliJ [Halobacillus andaensis]MBP2003493.1 flagellar FliJ protein [Halobacillus andaensis]GGF11030.1 hypothetical protein GCM10010954_07060 [Halobacillus andaensis]
MTTLQTFYKIKDLQEREKKEKQKVYQEQVDHFETVATDLYELLKRKETAADQFAEQLKLQTVKAQSFIQHEQFIEQLDKQINELQPLVQQARNDMENAHEHLSSAHIEVKKFDSLIDRRLQKHKDWLKVEENKSMDELSTRQFLNYKNR